MHMYQLKKYTSLKEVIDHISITFERVDIKIFPFITLYVVLTFESVNAIFLAEC